jgi:hypothetical protein
MKIGRPDGISVVKGSVCCYGKVANAQRRRQARWAERRDGLVNERNTMRSVFWRGVVKRSALEAWRRECF